MKHHKKCSWSAVFYCYHCLRLLWMGLSERLCVYQSKGWGKWAVLGETHQIAVKNLKTGADLWAFHVGEGPVHVKSSCGACLGSRKNCVSCRQWWPPLLPGPLSLLGGMRRKMLCNILPHYESDLNTNHSQLFKCFQFRQCFVLFFSWGIHLEWATIDLGQISTVQIWGNLHWLQQRSFRLISA